MRSARTGSRPQNGKDGLDCEPCAAPTKLLCRCTYKNPQFTERPTQRPTSTTNPTTKTMRSSFVGAIALAVALASVCDAQTLATNGNWSCALPKAYGGAGTCQPFCTSTYITASTAPSCSVALGSCPACTEPNYATQVPGVGSQTCTQSTDARCTSAALAALFSAWPNVQVQYSTFSSRRPEVSPPPQLN